VSGVSRPRSTPPRPTPGGSAWRTHLTGIGIEHQTLSDKDARTLSLILHGWQVIPSTPARSAPIVGRVWLAAALNSRGRYRAPEVFGHPADLEDGEGLIDSVVLMAVIQRHFLPGPEPAWDDVALARQLAVKRPDIARAQVLIDDTVALLPRAAAPLGPAWWELHDGRRR
jgi:hypothetical protein